MQGNILECFLKNEEYQRTAVGRYYYPCYLFARDIYNKNNNRKPGTKISHEELIRYFEGLEGENGKIGDKLRILRNNRNEADYGNVFDKSKVIDSKIKSEEILKHLK